MPCANDASASGQGRTGALLLRYFVSPDKEL